MGGLTALAVLVLIGFLLTYAHSHRADGRTSAIWDCGQDDCRYRNRAMHRHPASPSA